MKQKFQSLLKKPEYIFLYIGSVFGLLSLFIMPVMTIPDEGAHFWLSYGMFSKNERIPEGIMISAEDSASYVKDGTYIDRLFKEKADLDGDSLQFNVSKSLVGIYASNDSGPRSVSSFDLPRLPQALGVAVGHAIYPSIGVMTTIGRIFNLAFFLVAIFLIIRHVRFGKLAIAFLALFPMIIHQAASLSHDVVNIVVIFAWTALMINLFMQKAPITRKQLVLTTLLAVALVATKPSNILLLAFLPLLPLALYKSTSLFTWLRKRMPTIVISRRTLWTVGGIAIGLIGIGALYVIDAYLDRHGVGTSTFVQVLFNTFFRTDINTQLDPIVTTGIVGHFGWLWYKLPEWLVFAHLSVFALILLGDKVPKVSLRFALASLGIFIMSVAIITVGMYFLWTLDPMVAGPGAKFIQGVQGRYFTPLLILLIPAFAYLQKYISVRIKPTLLTTIAVSTAVFSLTVYIVLSYIFFFLPA